MRPVEGPEELERAFSLPLALIFKHSTRCGASAAAHEEVEELIRNVPDLPVFLVHVIEQRPLSQDLERRTGVIHRSPQVILLQGGAVEWHASHQAVRAEAIEARVRAASRVKDHVLA